MSTPSSADTSGDEHPREDEPRQDAGDRAVQAGGNVSGSVATGNYARATYEDRSVHHHYPTPSPKGADGQASVKETYIRKLADILLRKLHVTAGPLAVEWQNSDSERMSNPGRLITECLSRRRIILHGPAGAGKSMLLRRVALDCLQSPGAVPIIFDLSLWKPTHTAAMRAINDSVEARRQQFAILAHTSIVPINPDILDLLAEYGEVMLIVDGLNEVASQTTSATILNAIDAYLQQRPLSLCALVADRVHHDSSADLYQWFEFEMCPLGRPIIDAVLGSHFTVEELETVSDGDRSLLTLPFFVEQVISTGNLALGSAEGSLEQFYTHQQQLPSVALDSMSKMAFEMYQKSARSASLGFVKQWLPNDMAERLIADGTLQQSPNGEIQFDHQLKHDFFAARFLSKNNEEWNSESFNQVTFSANSIELLLSTVKILASVELGDDFIQAVYNWHWLPAVKTVGVSMDGAGVLFSKEVEVWLGCCAAEKVLDPLIWTGEATRALLQHLPNPTLAQAAAVRSVRDLVSLSHSIDSDQEWFLRWREILSLGGAGSIREENIQTLAGDDPVIAWAMSNAVKRWPLDESDLRQLRAIYRSAGDADVRWRVVHALGAFVSPANAKLLFAALDNDDGEWVRYGAIRSLVEIAILAPKNEGLRILQQLRVRLASLTSRLQLKLGEAVFVSNPPSGWGTAVAPLLREAASIQQMLVDIDSWNVLLRQFDRYERGLPITPPGR